MVITGGYSTQTVVSRYHVGAWLEDLPELITGRYKHACAGYTSSGRKVLHNSVSTIATVFFSFSGYFHLHLHAFIPSFFSSCKLVKLHKIVGGS